MLQLTSAFLMASAVPIWIAVVAVVLVVLAFVAAQQRLHHLRYA